ncbi:MAG: ribonuclease III [Flavobacteriales bacterium]|nr:ribonuclease III [Flavobacteriales bacterium]
MFAAFFNRATSPEERRIRAWCRKTLGVTPRNIPLYRQALRHRSALSEDRPDLEDNERLEFLGDAILDTIVGQFLYHHYPDKGEGFLTRMRSKLVSRHQLSILAKHVEIERVMELNIGRGQDTSVPGNAMEALFGALYLDKGFDRTKATVIKLITAHFDLKAVEQEDRDSKSRLLEWGQKQHRKVEFVLSEQHERGGRGRQFTAEVQVDGKTCGTGKGHSKKKAEQEAARDASRKLRLHMPDGGEANKGERTRRPGSRSRQRTSERRRGTGGQPGNRPRASKGRKDDQA